MSCLALLARRIRWFGHDLAQCLRGLAAARAYASSIDHPIAIALLEGATHAGIGHENSYRIRLANDSPDDLAVVLHVRGDAPLARSFVTRDELVLPAGASREVFVLTDWVGRFDVAAAPRPPEPFALVSAADDDAGTCRVTAMLEARGRTLDEQLILQPLLG